MSRVNPTAPVEFGEFEAITFVVIAFSFNVCVFAPSPFGGTAETATATPHF